MTRVAGLRFAAGLGVLLAAARARALPAPENDVPPPPPTVPEADQMVPPPPPPPPPQWTLMGVQVTAGGGVTGFFEQNTRLFLKTGGAWNVRGAIGTRWPFGIEAAYIGSVESITNLGLESGALLVGNGFDGALRFNPWHGVVQPYAFVGAGIINYRVTNTQLSNTDVQRFYNVFRLPVGAGGTWHVYRGLVIDLRATIGFTVHNNVLLPGTPVNAPFHNWGLAASAGWEF
jgi:hypothetical protein